MEHETSSHHESLVYRPELDALRGIAVLLVIGGHLLIPGMGGANLVGVTIFFVLSGYLITSILLNRGSLVSFYLRRARRLLPALFTWLAVLIVVGAITARDALPTLFYVANWTTTVTPLGHTWSLSAEEQFYALWPLALTLWKRPVWLLWAVAIGGAAARFLAPDQGLIVAASRFDALAWGCLLGLGVVPRVPRLVVALAIGLLAWFTVEGTVATMNQYGYTLIAIASFVVMAVLVRRPTGLLAHPGLMGIGRISYGLYLWHFPLAIGFYHVLFRYDGPTLVQVVGGAEQIALTLAVMAATFACAGLSWMLVERRFLLPSSRPGTRTGVAAGSIQIAAGRP
jgi:peptidoglycan/LPS O-acetylase OafA/YrhL